MRSNSFFVPSGAVLAALFQTIAELGDGNQLALETHLASKLLYVDIPIPRPAAVHG